MTYTIDPTLIDYTTGIRDGLLHPAQLHAEATEFWHKGYLVVRNVFSATEVGIARRAIADNPRMNTHLEHVRAKISAGKHPSFETIFVWNDTGGSDIFSKMTRNYAIFDRLCFFFQDHAYVYHNKVALKYPGISGFKFHQDYFYWYGMGNLFPDMATAQIAIDRSGLHNGCLRVVEGSHRLGRVDHRHYVDQDDTGVDEARLARILERLPEVHIELEAGDAVIFHCNTLHASGDNTSESSRIALLGCYNTRRNTPFESGTSGCPFYSPQASTVEPICTADERVLPDFDLRFD